MCVCVCAYLIRKHGNNLPTHTQARTQRRTLLIRRVAALFLVRFNQRHFQRFSISISVVCVCLLPAARLSLIALFAFVSVSVLLLLVPSPILAIHLECLWWAFSYLFLYSHLSHKTINFSFRNIKIKIIRKIKWERRVRFKFMCRRKVGNSFFQFSF